MRIKFMIHRSKKSFLKEQDIFKNIFIYYSKKHADIKILDKNMRLSILKGKHRIDFDYGYYRMKDKDFHRYDCIISTGLCAILNPKIDPGDLLLPAWTSTINISKKRTRVTLGKKNIKRDNKMERLMPELARFEKSGRTEDIKNFIRSDMPEFAEYNLTTIKDIRIHHKARMMTCNTIFIPSELLGAKIKMDNGLQQYLENGYDGLNCETWDMMQCRKPTLMLSWGLDKPYHTSELNQGIRDGKDLKKLLPTFNPAMKTYFYFILIGYMLSDDLRFK